MVKRIKPVSNVLTAILWLISSSKMMYQM